MPRVPPRLLQGGLGEGGHPDHSHHPQQHHHQEPESVSLSQGAQGVEVAHLQRPGGGQRLVHVSGQHRPHEEQARISRGAR